MLDRSRLQTAAEVRAACRDGTLASHTSGLADGFAQANLVVLPEEFAWDFLLFCQRNPKPCPVLEVTEPGDPFTRSVAELADLRTDLPKYRVWESGALAAEPTDLGDIWQDDFVAFLTGCSFTFDAALQRAGIEVRHVRLGRNVPMYRTNIACAPTGRFHGPLVVSMRPLSPADAIRAVEITSRHPQAHGGPVHLGLPEEIGIRDLAQPDFGDPVPVENHELPVFWACGVTSHAVTMAAKLPLVITHSPGCMFVTDVREV